MKCPLGVPVGVGELTVPSLSSLADGARRRRACERRPCNSWAVSAAVRGAAAAGDFVAVAGDFVPGAASAAVASGVARGAASASAVPGVASAVDATVMPLWSLYAPTSLYGPMSLKETGLLATLRATVAGLSPGGAGKPNPSPSAKLLLPLGTSFESCPLLPHCAVRVSPCVHCVFCPPHSALCAPHCEYCPLLHHGGDLGERVLGLVGVRWSAAGLEGSACTAGIPTPCAGLHAVSSW